MAAKGAFVKFNIDTDLMPESLQKELRVVEGILNSTPTERKQDGSYGDSSTNKAVMAYLDLTTRMIKNMVDQGLSYANGDYYVFVQFGGKPSVTKSPNGLIRSMSKLASKSGMIANINTGCVFEGYTKLEVVRSGCIDTLLLENDCAAEVGDVGIVAPYAVVTLIDRDTKNIISRKIFLVRSGEYQAAKGKGSYTHKLYPVPMAQKIALRRAAEEMAAALGIDDSVELANLKAEVKEHDSEYKINGDETIDDVCIGAINEAVEKGVFSKSDLDSFLARGRFETVQDITVSAYETIRGALNAK